MLILALLSALLSLAFSAPTSTSQIDVVDLPAPTMNLTIFGHEFLEYVKPARLRTMQGIIWSCLATIFACTWVSMHPNVPDPRFSARQRLCERLKLLFYALTGPEFVAVWAYRQKMMATEYAEIYNQRFKLNPPRRSKWQKFKELFCLEEDRKARKSDPAWTATHGFLFEMQGLECFQDGRPSAIQPFESDRNSPFSLPKQVGRTAVVCHPSQLRDRFDISEEEIKDRSKGDGFTKFFAICQTLWFMIQCIARWVTHLRVTDLEVVTLAFAFANIMIYYLWWNKPQNMAMAIRINQISLAPRRSDSEYQRNKIESGPSLVSSEGEAEGTPDPFGLGRRAQQTENEYDNEENADHTWSSRIRRTYIDFLSFLPTFVVILGVDSLIDISREVRIRFYTSETMGNRGNRVAFMTGVVGTVFGGVHLIPIWLSSFPSFMKKQLWIMSTLIIIVMPFGLASTAWVLRRVPPSPISRLLSFMHATVNATWSLYYISCRSILIYLAFDNLRFLPPDAFLNVEWSTYFPHI